METCKLEFTKEYSDYQKRYIQEYAELKERYEKLVKKTIKYDAGTLEFVPYCPIEILKEQEEYMRKYLRCLRIRAEIENVILPE